MSQTTPTLIGNTTTTRLTKPAGTTTLIGSGYDDIPVYVGELLAGDSFIQTNSKGAGAGYVITQEVLTLSTSSTLTTSTTALLPANSLIVAVTAIPTVNLAGTTGFQLGDPSSNTRFTSSSSTNVTTTSAATVGVTQWDPASATTAALSPIQVTATSVVVKANIQSTAGALRIVVLSTPTTGPTS